MFYTFICASGKLVGTMLESRPSPSLGVMFGYSLIAGLLLLDSGLLLLLFNQPVTVMSFLWGALLLASAPAIAQIAYWTSSLSVARYHVEGDALMIEWAHIREVIPLDHIQALETGETVAKVNAFRGARWPGCFVGHGYVTGSDQRAVDQPTTFLATTSLPRQLLLVTDMASYALSPDDLTTFVDCLQALRVSELERNGEQVSSARSFLDWPIWRDRLAGRALVAAIALNSALFAFLCAMYVRLPVMLSLRVDQAGALTRTVPPANLFVLPVLGLIAWIVNGALGGYFYQIRAERPPAFVLWGSSIMLQLVAWAAFLTLLR